MARKPGSSLPFGKPPTAAERAAADPFLRELDAHPWREHGGRIYRYERPPHTLFAVRAVVEGPDGRPCLDRLEARSREWLRATTPAEPPEGLTP